MVCQNPAFVAPFVERCNSGAAKHVETGLVELGAARTGAAPSAHKARHSAMTKFH